MVVEVEIWCRSGRNHNHRCRNHNHRSPCLVGREGNQVSNVTGDLGSLELFLDLILQMFNLVAPKPGHDRRFSQAFTAFISPENLHFFLIHTAATRKKSPALSKAFILVPMVSTLLWNEKTMDFVLCPHDKQLYKREDKRGCKGTTSLSLCTHPYRVICNILYPL